MSQLGHGMINNSKKKYLLLLKNEEKFFLENAIYVCTETHLSIYYRQYIQQLFCNPWALPPLGEGARSFMQTFMVKFLTYVCVTKKVKSPSNYTQKPKISQSPDGVYTYYYGYGQKLSSSNSLGVGMGGVGGWRGYYCGQRHVLQITCVIILHSKFKYSNKV